MPCVVQADHTWLHSVCLLCVTLPFYAFSALTLLVGRQEEHPACNIIQWWWAGVVMCLVRCKWLAYGPADGTATWWSSLASFKSRLV